MSALDAVVTELGDRAPRWLAPLLRLLDCGIVTPDGTLFLAAHEAAHALDLGLTDCRGSTINEALKALRPKRRLEAEAVAVAVSLMVCWKVGGLGQWSREAIVQRVVEDSEATARLWRRRSPGWTRRTVDAAVQRHLYMVRALDLYELVLRGDVPRG